MDLNAVLEKAVELEASDIIITAGLPIAFKVGGGITHFGETLSPNDTENLCKRLYMNSRNREFNKVSEGGDDDFSFGIKGLARFRINAFRQRGSYAAVIRVVSFSLPNPEEMNILPQVMKLAEKSNGLVLITGPAGSGKTTTLACMVDYINKNREGHIITLEDPIEFLHNHNRSVVTQREISIDSESYEVALRAAMRQAPNVILLGEMRDAETIKAAVTAAETGHLVLSTLHTVGAANTIDRIIDCFDPRQQHQIRAQLAMVLEGVVSQLLIPSVNGKIVPAFEIMTATPAIRTMLREAKTHQLESTISTSSAEGMITMDASILKLVQDGTIAEQSAIGHAQNSDMMQKKILALKNGR